MPKNSIPFDAKQLFGVLRNEVSSKRDTRKYIAESMGKGMAALLRYEDRDSMAHSIESRVPFLDYSLAELIYSMPLDYKLRKGVTKAVLRDGLKGILPDKIRKRYSKLGFVTPEDQWMNNNYMRYREELRKAAERLSGILDVDRVMKWFDGNKGKIQRGDFMTWRIICAGHWAEVFHVQL